MRQLITDHEVDFTNRESQSLEKYLQEIGKVELIKGPVRRRQIGPYDQTRTTSRHF